MTTDERLDRIERKLDELLSRGVPAKMSIETKIAHGALHGRSAEDVLDLIITEAKAKRRKRR